MFYDNYIRTILKAESSEDKLNPPKSCKLCQVLIENAVKVLALCYATEIYAKTRSQKLGLARVCFDGAIN